MSARVIAEIAFRNLFASKWKTLFIGLGALLVVVGGAVVDGVDRAMRRSVTGSLSGHIQVYSSASKGELELMGSWNGGALEVEPLNDFERVRTALLSVPNVAAVVPMGVDSALVSSGNTVDQALSKLRNTVNLVERGDASEPSWRMQARPASTPSCPKKPMRSIEPHPTSFGAASTATATSTWSC